MRITTWNVNSIRKRLDGVLQWLERERPDILCLQETKCTDDTFPWIGFKSAGYEISYTGQPAYNGVAIVSRLPQEEINLHPVAPNNEDRRSIASTIDGIRIINVYVPYGEKVGSEKFSKKLLWINSLREQLVEPANTRMIVTGDFNIAPDDRDVYDPEARHEKLICSTLERNGFRALLKAGFVDALRQCTDQANLYTWWSHRVGAVEDNRGLRVDHHLVHNSLEKHIQSVEIDTEERKRPNSSDHTPITLTIESKR